MARVKMLTCSMRVSRRSASIVMSSPDERAKKTVAPSRCSSNHSMLSVTRPETHSGSSVSRVRRRTSARYSRVKDCKPSRSTASFDGKW